MENRNSQNVRCDSKITNNHTPPKQIPSSSTTATKKKEKKIPFLPSISKNNGSDPSNKTFKMSGRSLLRPSRSPPPPSGNAGGDVGTTPQSKGGGGGGLTGTEKDDESKSRYKHDMEQALAMQKSTSHRRMTRKQQIEDQLSKDVALGLQGLEQADAYREESVGAAAAAYESLERAMRLYELSLELLIRVLKETSQAQLSTIHGIDTTTIEARVHVALEDAENIKSILELKPQPQQRQKPSESSAEVQAPPSSSPTSTMSSYINTTFQSLSNALTSAISATTTSSLLQQQQQAASARAAKPRATAGSVRTRPRPATTTSARRQQNQLQPQHPNTATNATSATTGIKLSPQEELRQTILSDFYVDPKSLQHTTWDDICGLDRVKQSLQETAILPLVRPDLFQGLRKPQNILLYGPPGTGKTLLVRAVAQESSCASLFVVTASTLTSKWMGESEKLVRMLFQIAHEYAPSVVFVDEVDSLLSNRKSDGNEHEASRRLKTEFMVQMDGIQQQQQQDQGGGRGNNKRTSNPKTVLVLANTNCPWDLDSAILRRFPKRIYVPMPDPEARKGLIKYLLKKNGNKHSLTAKQIDVLVQRTEGYSGSDIAALASEASFGPIRSLGNSIDAIRNVKAKDVRPINMHDFEYALEQTSKSVTAEHLHKYDDWKQRTTT